MGRTSARKFCRIVIAITICFCLFPYSRAAGRGEKKPKDYLKNVGGGLNIFSPSDEKSLGERYSGELNRKLALMNSEQVQGYIETLGKRLVQSSRKPDLNCSFRVVNTREVNAFALPGCFIYVNRGLIDLAENDGQLAGVMAHEIGHVVGRHAARQMSKQLVFLGAVAGASAAVSLKSEKWGTVIAAAGGIGAMLASLKYSRDDEHQADALAAETVTKAGYNPNELVTFFHRMDPSNSPGKMERALNLLNTHPPIPDRETALTQQIKKTTYDATDHPQWAQAFQSCKQDMAAIPLPPANREVTLSRALAAVGLAEGSRDPNSPEPIGSREEAPTVLDLPGNAVWLGTGIEVREGTVIEIWSEGEIFVKKNSDLSCDPSGVFATGKGFFKPISKLNTGALLGRIVTEDKSEPFPIGTHRVLRAGAAGRLELGINDDNNFDNRGSFKVWILTR